MFKMSNRAFIGVCLVCVVGLGLLLYAVGADWFSRQSRPSQVAQRQAELEQKKRQSSILPPDPDWVKVGGVWRPQRDVKPLNKNDSPPKKLVSNVGRSPAVPADLNRNVESIVEAITENRFPERRSALFPPAPFDREQFLANPQAYLDIVEPGRAFQTLPVDSDAPPIVEQGGGYFRILQGESVVLRARVNPHMPVSFYTPDLGQFDNRLTAITQQADENGLVETRFTASPGTRGQISIVAGSPTSKGQARYLVEVKLPR